MDQEASIDRCLASQSERDPYYDDHFIDLDKISQILKSNVINTEESIYQDKTTTIENEPLHDH
jgi:hypothetical protein